jgi:CheY-like chemotaxis protein
MVVDDDAAIREPLVELLQAEGYHLLEACDGHEALEQLRRLRKPCHVVLDLMMPRMNGHEFLAHVRASPELQSMLHIVVCSANLTLPRESPPVEAVLAKPFELDALLTVLRRTGYA